MGLQIPAWLYERLIAERDGLRANSVVVQAEADEVNGRLAYMRACADDLDGVISGVEPPPIA